MVFALVTEWEHDRLRCGRCRGDPRFCFRRKGPGVNEGYSSELYAIYLPRAGQGKGVGSGLFWAVVRDLVGSGWNSMFVWVLKANESRHFYERAGD